MSTLKRLLLIPLVLLLAGCATYYNPVTQKTEYTAYSEQDEIDMGTAADKKIQEEYKVVEATAEIKKIFQKVASVSDRPGLNYTIRVVENKEVNAFALPGGFVYLHTGLIEKTESNDELACIIGHEITHICARDGVNQMQKSILYSIPASILLQNRSAAIQNAVNAAFTLSMLKYSRTQELRADTHGVTYAYRAGYDPEGMITFFKKLQEIEESGSSSTTITFLRSHPNTEDRIENVREVIQGLRSDSGSAWKKNTL
jgi:beta-barrel assembly-enhancing protease